MGGGVWSIDPSVYDLVERTQRSHCPSGHRTQLGGPPYAMVRKATPCTPSREKQATPSPARLCVCGCESGARASRWGGGSLLQCGPPPNPICRAARNAQHVNARAHSPSPHNRAGSRDNSVLLCEACGGTSVHAGIPGRAGCQLPLPHILRGFRAGGVVHMTHFFSNPHHQRVSGGPSFSVLLTQFHCGINLVLNHQMY